jgi:hypothetical protein
LPGMPGASFAMRVQRARGQFRMSVTASAAGA